MKHTYLVVGEGELAQRVRAERIPQVLPEEEVSLM